MNIIFIFNFLYAFFFFLHHDRGARAASIPETNVAVLNVVQKPVQGGPFLRSREFTLVNDSERFESSPISAFGWRLHERSTISSEWMWSEGAAL